MNPIVIAGNGPSLAKIDYSRLPQDFDVFRCNQYKYFLGKKIKGGIQILVHCQRSDDSDNSAKRLFMHLEAKMR